jgi:hypothetical protein
MTSPSGSNKITSAWLEELTLIQEGHLSQGNSISFEDVQFMALANVKAVRRFPTPSGPKKR